MADPVARLTNLPTGVKTIPHFLLPDEEYRFTFICALESQVSMNSVLGKITGPAPPAATTQELVDKVSLTFAPFFAALICNQAGYYGVTCRRTVGFGGQPHTVYSRVGATVGTGGAKPLPKQATGLLALLTDEAGKNKNGRLYLPFPAAENEEATLAVPNGAYIIAGEDLGNALLQTYPVVAGAGTPFVHFGLHGPSLTAFIDFADYRCRPYWATQKKRGSYGRTNVLPF